MTTADLLLENNTLRCRIKSLRQEVESFRSGRRYLKLQEDYRRTIAGYIREIRRLRALLADEKAHAVTVRDIWFDECESNWNEYRKELDGRDREIARLKNRVFEEMRKGDERLAAAEERHKEELSERDAVIEALKAEIAHYEALMGRDSTNTSMPTGQTPPGKKKHIPNTRRSTGRKKGGQPGHAKHEMGIPPEEEINDEADHYMDEGDTCPACGYDYLRYTGEYEDRYEVDVEVKVINRLHRYWLYECMNCGEIVHAKIDPSLRARSQYGPNVQAIAVSLVSSSNSAFNKVPLFLSGITGGKVSPCEGYIAKLQERAARNVSGFSRDLFRILATRPIVYWDDTVVTADGKKICFRFYGDERVAYYVAHEKKDLKGILEDGVLTALADSTYVMHDHNTVNYNKRFHFKNIECNAHLQRDLKKSSDETGHTETEELRELISATIKDRNDLVDKGETGFDKSYVDEFNRKLSDILGRAGPTAEANESIYSGNFERAVVNRVIKHRENFFAWVTDFSLPVSNNLSERALRCLKSKMRVSGQFASAVTADNHALVRSYIETCRRNGVNEIAALVRAFNGNPVTVAELFPDL